MCSSDLNALAQLSVPSPYLAVLVADGDRMGEAISRLTTADENRAFSRTLATFAGRAREIVEQHQGVLVYAGGDDVLAFVPVDKCLACARELHDTFATCLAEYRTTLSVGVAIGHFMENLEDLLDYGRAAEKAAKSPDRDGLAVHLHKRGGAPIPVRAPWTSGLDVWLVRAARLLRAEVIPSKLPYDLRQLADLYADWSGVPDAMRCDVLRVIRDKQPRAGRAYLPEIERRLAGITTAASLREFAQQLLVARQVAVALGQAGEPPVPPPLEEVS